jgi:DNA-binding SARP family transcriptional activator
VSELLELVAHGVTAILATWLGLLVVTRARRSPGASVFGGICLLLVVWSTAILVQRVGANDGIYPGANVVEDFAAFLLPAATAHIALLIAYEGRSPGWARTLLAGAYLLALLTIVQAALDPGHPIEIDAPHFEPVGIPGALLGWTFIWLRAVVFAAAVAWLVTALRGAGEDRSRQRQLQFALATLAVGVLGGILRILPVEVGGPKWLGVSLVALSMVLAANAVLTQGVFLGADAAGRAFRTSVLGGMAVVAYVGLGLGLDALARSALGLDVPIVAGLAVVVTIVLFEPLSDVLTRLVAIPGGDSQQLARARLQRAIGIDGVTSQRPEEAVQPALARLARTFHLTGADLTDGTGSPIASVGEPPGDAAPALRLPLTSGSSSFGSVRFGPKRSGLPFDQRETESLTMAASYLADSLRLEARHEEQASSLAELREEGEQVSSAGTALTEALVRATEPAAGLHVYALGPLRAERDGEPMTRWGGEKAGSRQAEAVFAFLFDRGEAGAAKDEILELIWPDVDLDRADDAFHRTLLGLRSMLQPDRRARTGPGGPVPFHHDRYRLAPGVVAWSDIGHFDALLTGMGELSRDEATARLEQARALYRGEYLDDCPFYGDSVQVEERREELRRRYLDLLNELGERYDERGDRSAAAAVRRHAETLAADI